MKKEIVGAPREILAVRREKLFAGGRIFNGFRSIEDARALGINQEAILSKGEYLPKSELEHKQEYKQIVAYCILLGENGEIFSYKRGPREPRLKDKWSLGIGGHIYKLESKFDMLKSNVIKRVNQEVNIGMRAMGLRHLGYINCEDVSVDRDHLGMLYLKEVYDVSNIKLQKEAEEDLLHAEFRTHSQIERLINQHRFEEWSVAAYYDVLLKENIFKPREFYHF